MLLLSAFVAVVFLQVISRNFLKVSMDWTSEVALLTFVWSVMSGAAVALSMRRHYMVDLIPVRYVKLNKGVLILSDLLVMALILSLIRGGPRPDADVGPRSLTSALASGACRQGPADLPAAPDHDNVKAASVVAGGG